MTSLLWENKFNPSVEIVMIQRDTISACMNALHEGFSDIRRSCVHINGLLDQLRQLCQTHFSYEEQLLEELRYPPTEEQKTLHDTFLKEIDQLKCDEGLCHSPTVIGNYLQLRLKYIANTTRETMLLCDYLTGRLPETPNNPAP